MRSTLGWLASRVDIRTCICTEDEWKASDVVKAIAIFVCTAFRQYYKRTHVCDSNMNVQRHFLSYVMAD